MLPRWQGRWRSTPLVCVCAAALAGALIPASPVTRAQTSGGAYFPLSPYRLLDTRATRTPIGAAGTQQLTVTGVDGVPQSATAVVLNVTATDPTSGSYLAVYPAGEPTPTVSNLNFSPGETVPNLTVVPVGTGGQVAIYNSVGSVQVVVDLEGYFEAEPGPTDTGSYVALTPARIADTRPGSGQPLSGQTLTPGDSANVQVEGAGGVPSSGVEAAVLNVTVTDTTRASYLTVYPTGTGVPLASNLNWWAGDTVANRVIAPMGSSGQVTFYNSLGDTDLVVDVVGYFTEGSNPPGTASLYYPMSPVRLLDTRHQAGTLQPSGYLPEQFGGVDGISETADAVVANLTSVNSSAGSFFSMLPEQSGPATSDLNFSPGQTIPNLVIVSLNQQGGASIFNDLGTADALVDVFGYFEPIADPPPDAPPPCTSATLTVEAGTDAQGYVSVTQGSPLTVDTSPTCPNLSPPSYEYWYKPWYFSVWNLAQSWTSQGSYTYDTTSWTAGTYDLVVWVSTAGYFQSDAANGYVVSDPDYQWQSNTIPPQSALLGFMVTQANAGVVAGCYGDWAAGRNCDEDGDPGQCTFWAELNWASPYFSEIKGNAAQLPESYTQLTGRPIATTPSVGALVVWNGPGVFAGSGNGHVAVVTSVAPDGSSYTVSQMNWTDLGWDISSMTVPFSPSDFGWQGLAGFLPPG